MDAKRLDIKNRVFPFCTKLVNILDFDVENLEIEKGVCSDVAMYYINYDEDHFFLVIDNFVVLLLF